MHCGYIVEIKSLRKHTNADRLQIATIFGNSVVVSDKCKVGDIGIYFPVDLQLGEEYAKENNLCRLKDENGKDIGGFLDPAKRNIKAISLRGEKSDGLFMPLSSLEKFCDISELEVGNKTTVLNGKIICQKYVPKSTFREKNGAFNAKNGKKVVKKVKNKFPFFKEHLDTAQLAYNEQEFRIGDVLTISLKMHGTSSRFSNTIQVSEKKRWLRKPLEVKNWECVSGSRRVVLNFKDNQSGYYNNNEFREKWHSVVSKNLNKGETVYGEIVGWVDNNKTIMNVCKNSKISKEFVKQYGDTTTFSYGCKKGENDFYIYRMTMTNEDGFTVEYPTWYAQIRAEEMGLKFVPVIKTIIFTTWEDLMKEVGELCDGEDLIDPTHIREGVVVRIENRQKFKAFKHKGFTFKVLEGIIKEEAIEPDMEEMENVEQENLY